jgi:hypothetical protein
MAEHLLGSAQRAAEPDPEKWFKMNFKEMPLPVQRDWAKLGWTHATWDQDGCPPVGSAWEKDWSKLSREEEISAKNLGYTPEMWGDVKGDAKNKKKTEKEVKKEQKKHIQEERAKLGHGLEKVPKESTVEISDQLDGHPVHGMGWYNVHPTRVEMQHQAAEHLQLIRERCQYWRGLVNLTIIH